jgi:PAS domain S-box-containing protein
MEKPLRVLMVEDSEDDVLLAVRALRKGCYDPVYERVETAEAMRDALRQKPWNVILCDYRMPKFSGLAAIALLKETGIDIPLIIVSGAIGEETAVDCMRSGAHDYVMKGNLSRLAPAVERELKEAKSRGQRKRMENDLKEASEKLRSLTSYVDSMYLVDKNCTYLFMNERHLKRFGLSSEEVVGKKYGEFHSAEDTKQLAEDVREVCETGNPITKEHQSERDGKFFLRTFTPIMGRGKDGIILQIAVISKDITHIKSAEKKLQTTLDSLRRAVNTTIQVMVSAVETRDPYTAGHQIRSADLARAIADEMALTQEKIDGIRIAGSIHDIGKLSIPAEILSKPTKLSNLEFSLIKEHANRGYEILKNVESSWPLAEIVHQHHERMDGSGYPKHLKGDAILIEARILAVADVVESMASHRPYRPALGTEAALEEIEKNRGILYDADAVDACLKVFREKRYKMDL